MDGDPAVEPELDSFSLTFPLPYRVAFIVVLAVWGWGLNLHYLYLVKIDVPALIRYPGRPSPHHPPHHLSVYRLASVLTTVFGFSLVLFWLFTRRDPDLVLAWDWLPLVYLAVLVALLAAPLPRNAILSGLPHAGRARLRSTLRRIALGGIAEAKDGKFGDILLADVLTSYAKVFGDLYVALCMFLRTDGSATARPDRGCGGVVVVPLILAIPSLIRLRQCLIEYGRVRRGPLGGSAGWGGQHLANALKYSTAFPVVILNAYQRNHPSSSVFRLWVVACLVNSLYSFYWDVAKDWDLELFQDIFSRARDRNYRDQQQQLQHPFGLRRTLRLGPPALYYAVIATDLLLRCTWGLKLLPGGRLDDSEASVFAVEALEVARRWVWIFFRVETEWVRNNNTSSAPGMGMGMGLLGGESYDDDDDENLGIALGDMSGGKYRDVVVGVED
ncbi:EXS-domain-containing protein [Xylariaceae sp. FL0594]|nr:EXS-domain-containing protein [Xylariaceae sp. FL0594]